MSPTPIEKGQPFTEERTQQIIRDFKRDGFMLIPDVLGREEVTALREKTDSLIDDPDVVRDGYVQLVGPRRQAGRASECSRCWTISSFIRRHDTAPGIAIPMTGRIPPEAPKPTKPSLPKASRSAGSFRSAPGRRSPTL